MNRKVRGRQGWGRTSYAEHASEPAAPLRPVQNPSVSDPPKWLHGPQELPSQMPAHTLRPSASRLEVPGDCLSTSTPVLLNQGASCSWGTCDNTWRSFMLLPLGGDISRVQARDAADLPAMPRMAQLMQGSAGTPQHVGAATPERPSLPPY